MQFKIDENLHEVVAETLCSLGFDAVTVNQQGMQGNPDIHIGEICQQEKRVLVTLDLDFANIRAFPPADYPGLIVLRLRDQSKSHVIKTIESLINHLKTEPVEGSLWIVEEHQIRIRRNDP